MIPGKPLIKRNLFVQRGISVDRESVSEGFQYIIFVRHIVGSL